MTLTDYYKRFQSVFGALAALIGSIPLFSILVHDSVGKYIFPPLGGFETVAGIVAFVLAVQVTFVVFYMKDAEFIQSRQRRIGRLFRLLGGSLVALLAYLMFYTTSVCTLSVADVVVTNSIGFERTQFAKQTFVGLENCEMLKERGPYEGQVRKLWTMRSIVIARSALLVTYLICLLGTVGLTSLAVLYDACGPAPNP